MEKYFCYGKKDFCDSIDKCQFCKFFDGTGCVDGELAHSILSGIFGEDYDLDRLKRISGADREGRLIVSPCKIRDVVWSTHELAGMNSHQIKIIERNEEGDFACSALMFDFKDFGKTWFLNKQEAEAALEKMKERDR